MDIVILTEHDFSGNMYNLASSINKYTKHHAITIKLLIHPIFRYPTMIHATRDNLPEIRDIIYKADAVVWKELPSLIDQFGLEFDRMSRKNNVVILGGGGYSSDKFYFDNQWTYGELGAKWATSSLDFTTKNPDWAWIPASIRVEYLREKYDMTKVSPPLLFASPSTGTDRMMDVRGKFNYITSQLKKENHKFRSKVVFKESNNLCLHLKAQADIFFDRIWDIYGINSQEAGAFESAIITGSSNFVRSKIKELGYDCPFIFVDHHVLAIDEISYLLENPDETRRIGRECYRYVQKLHNGELAVKNLMKVIRE